ncbi:MAG TPA: hypothetical protein PKB07_13565 [Flavilitoribacter sp.]|nr:hypothetical protein [Flavilitoribacter sp.]
MPEHKSWLLHPLAFRIFSEVILGYGRRKWAEQLLVLSNLQSLNAKLMKWGCDTEQRLQILNDTAIEEMSILLSSSSLKQLPGDSAKRLGKGKK